jgi:hypothetical protein
MKKKHQVALKPLSRPDFDGKKVGCNDLIPMSRQKLFPRRLPGNAVIQLSINEVFVWSKCHTRVVND